VPDFVIFGRNQVTQDKMNHPQTKADKVLMECLVCPVSKRPLRYDADKQELVSDAASLAFPLRDGIPVMLVEEARKL